MRSKQRNLVFALVLVGLTMQFGCKKKEEEPAVESEEAAAEVEISEEEAFRARVEMLFQPIPLEVEVDEQKVELGRALYHDPGLSGDGTVSCATCHGIADGGDDGLATSLGIKEQVGPINSPTVLNAAYHTSQFWDGRAADLQEQALGPVENPIEMGQTWDEVEKYLASEQDYRAAFEDLYEDGVTADNAAHAIAEFERTLITPNAPFDQYLRGDDEALNEQEMRGLEAFVDTGCIACHNGKILSSPGYQKMGVVHDYFADRGDEITEADLGRFNVTGEEKDRHLFKVPTLRNVTMTAPYMHDGRTEDLHEAVRMMAWYQLGKELEEDVIEDIVAFLHTLDGEIPEVSTSPELAL